MTSSVEVLARAPLEINRGATTLPRRSSSASHSHSSSGAARSYALDDGHDVWQRRVAVGAGQEQKQTEQQPHHQHQHQQQVLALNAAARERSRLSAQSLEKRDSAPGAAAGAGRIDGGRFDLTVQHHPNARATDRNQSNAYSEPSSNFSISSSSAVTGQQEASGSANRFSTNQNNSSNKGSKLNRVQSLTLPRSLKPTLSKPSILSPKPFVAPKPKSLRPNSADQVKSAPTSGEGIFRFNPTGIRKVSAPNGNTKSKQVTTFDAHVPKQGSQSSVSTNSSGNAALSPRSSNSAPQSPPTPMESPVFIAAPQAPDIRKLPPKVASKPKHRPPSLTIKSEISNGIASPEPLSPPIDSSDPALAPVSEIRQRFEKMKMKFKKPEPDPKFTPPTSLYSPYGENNGTMNPTANELFRDILNMKDLESFGDDETYDSDYLANNPDLLASPSKSELEYLKQEPWSLEHERPRETVDASQNLQDLKNRYEHEFESKLINSLISPTEKKKFFKDGPTSPALGQHQQPVVPAFPHSQSSPNVGKLSHEAVFAIESRFAMPAYPKPSNDQTLMFDDDLELPPPPDLPPPPEPPQDDGIPGEATSGRFSENSAKEPKDSVAKTCQQPTAWLGSNHRAPAVPQRIDSKRATPQDTAGTRGISKQQSWDNGVQRSATGSLNSSADQSSAEISRQKQAGETAERAAPQQQQFWPGDVANESVGTFPVSIPYDQQSPPKQQRDIDEEILYYDNMDIMEKVRQKREQEEKRREQQIKAELARQRDTSAGLTAADTNARQASNNDKAMFKQSSPQQIMAAGKSPQPQIQPNYEETDTIRRNKNAGKGHGHPEFRNAIGELEFEYKKLKENLSEDSVALPPKNSPPKLPPKQLKFNRQSVAKRADSQSSPDLTPTESQEKAVTEQAAKRLNQAQLRLNVIQPQSANVPHMPSPMPQPLQPAFPLASSSALSTTLTTLTPSAIMQQQLLAQQFSPEEVRARTLVDEPLAPILEEDSTYGDSSSCASSVTGDDASAYAEEYTLNSRHGGKQVTSLGGSALSSVASSRRALNEDSELDGETTETETVMSEHSARGGGSSTAMQSTSSSTEESDASSVRWQSNPMLFPGSVKSPRPNNQPIASVTSPKAADRPFPLESQPRPVFHPAPKDLAADNEGDYEFISDEDTESHHSSRHVLKRDTSRESRLSESSVSGGRSAEGSRSSQNESISRHEPERTVPDVEPYGMVDLSKLEPTIVDMPAPRQPDQFRRSTSSNEQELTPSSIMSSVNEFNEAVAVGTLKRSKSREQEDGNLSDTPNFPLDFSVNKKPKPKKRSAAPTSKPPPPVAPVRRSSFGAAKSEEVDEIGYDNLENYGGETRRAAEEQRAAEQHRERLNSQKYAKANKKKSELRHSGSTGKLGSHNSNDSLASEPGLSRQSAGSRGSLPLSITEEHLARHSSAVSALDRHKGNIQRSKSNAKAEAQVRSPSARRLDRRQEVKQQYQQQQQQQQPSTLPRTRNSETNGSFDRDNFEKVASRSVDVFESTEHYNQQQKDGKSPPTELLSSRNRAPDIRQNLHSASQEISLKRQAQKPTSPLRSRAEDRSPQVRHIPNSSPDLRELATTPNKEYKPFPVSSLDYDESLDDGIVNPYEEVPFRLEGQPEPVLRFPAPDTEEQKEAKNRVQEILDNIKPPESPYKPKPPLPRYPVGYDNFSQAEKERESRSRASSGIGTDEKKGSASGATSSSSPPPSPLVDERSKTSGFSDAAPTPVSTPASVRSHKRTPSKGSTSPHPDDSEHQNDSSDTPSSTAPRSIGFQLRNLLGGNQEGKYISPSLRRKRSLLKRSKSPGGSSRRARTPPRSKSPSKSETDKSVEASQDKQSLRDSKLSSADRQSIKSEVESEVSTPRTKERSASQRVLERRGRGLRSSFRRRSKASEAEEDSTGTETDKSKKMSSKWRRSKSQDRSPERSKSKERKFLRSSFRRAKSQERPNPKALEAREINIGEDDEERGGRSFFRRSRSSSRKRDRRAKSIERKEDINSSGSRGRNPVSFFRKLLRNKKEDEEGDADIVQVPLGKGVDLSESTEALTTILAYKGDEVSEKEQWNPPRPNPPQQGPAAGGRQQTPKSGSAASSPSKGAGKAMHSPLSHRSKKMLSSRAHGDHSTGSSSEGVAADHKSKRTSDAYGNLGTNRAFLTPPQKPARPSSRKSSFSNSLPSSDSERHSKADDALDLKKSALRHQLLNKSGTHLRRNLLTNREYDSDTATSVLASDADSSTGVQSDVDSGVPSLRSAMKRGTFAKLKGTLRDSIAPRRPVRVVSPRRSKSDPSIFVDNPDPKSTYYNINEDGTPKSNQPEKEKKRASKLAPHRRRNQKQSRRQTAPVDLAYQTHQRKKYRTLVSLNAQTLRKVTERWLSEWRNKLPVGGFLITSWSDVALESHRPLCMIGNSVVYSSISTGNNQFKLACQLYDQLDVDDRMMRRLDSCASLPAHPNTCGVCSSFPCRVPRSLLDPNSRGGAADALCVVLSSRPYQSMQEHLDRVVIKEEPTEYHRQVLITVLQLLQGMRHLLSSGFDLPGVSAEHLVITEERGFLQILPHLDWSDSDDPVPRKDVNRVLDAYQSSDSDNNAFPKRLSHTQQVARLIKKLLHNGSLVASTGGLGRPGDRGSAASSVSRVVVPGTKFSSAIKHIIHYLDASPPVGIQEAIDVVQCALWGPEDLEDVGVDDVSPYSALELWIELEQAKLVNSLAVLTPGERLLPISFLKHQYFATVHPEVLFKGLKVLQRI